GIATSHATQKGFGGGNSDAFVAGFTLCTLSSSATGTTASCIHGNGYYKATPHPNSSYIWTVDGGTIISGGSSDSIVVQWTASGKRSVKLKEASLTGCLDSVIIPVTVYTMPKPAVAASSGSGGCVPFTVQ